MNRLALLALLLPSFASAQDLSFDTKEIETALGVGYAVLLVDVNDDAKKDIVVVDKTRVLWYENPTWKRHILTEGQTRPDNVCIAAADINGDGKLEFAVGAGWQNLSGKASGPLYWLQRGDDVTKPWKVHPIDDEVSVHRIRFADLDGSGKPSLIVSPLLGRDSTKEKNFMDGQPVHTFALKVPKDPVKERWQRETIDRTMHVIHNVWPIPAKSGKGMDLLAASYEGVNLLQRDGDKWTRRVIGSGNQDNPNSNRGASEIKQGHVKRDRPFIATIEPWHGHQVVVYTPPESEGKLWERHVVDQQLKWGHAVFCADLDGDGAEELIIGVRDNLGKATGEKCGVRVYKATDGKGAKWQRQLVDEGGVAVEDLAAADLDNDGRIDIVAVGRQTKNARIYWNRGRP